MNMHVPPGTAGTPDPRRDQVVRRFLQEADGLVSLGSQELQEQRAGNRAIIASRLELIWGACEPHIRGVDARGDQVAVDYRFVDLGVRVLDRLGRVLRVDREDPPVPQVEVVDRDPNAVVVSRDLDALEARMRGGGEVQGA